MRFYLYLQKTEFKRINIKMRIKQVSAPQVLNESYEYEKPVPFSRGLEIDLDLPAKLVILSGTASVDHEGRSIHIGDITAQARRTFDNITALLLKAGLTWQDVVKTTIYLKDIKRDYDVLNRVRNAFFREVGITLYPASTCVQAELCREELLVEIETWAIKEKKSSWES